MKQFHITKGRNCVANIENYVSIKIIAIRDAETDEFLIRYIPGKSNDLMKVYEDIVNEMGFSVGTML